MVSKFNSLPETFWSWVHANANLPLMRLAQLARKDMAGDLANLAVVQVEARRKASLKLRGWLEKYPDFLFPSTLLVEQCTMPAVASFNASRAGELKGKRVLDLTFGLGIDAFYFAEAGAEVTGVDCNPVAVAAGNYNASRLDMNVKVECATAEIRLQSAIEQGEKFDIVYLDPARRKSGGERAYGLADCEPDFSLINPLAPAVARSLFVKVSPMLDPDDLMNRYGAIKDLWSVGLKGECKELLLHFDYSGAPVSRSLHAVELGREGVEMQITEAWPRKSVKIHHETCRPEPGRWISIPTASVVRIRPWHTVGTLWPELVGCGNNSLIFVSKSRPEGFPGKTMRIEKIFTGVRQATRELEGKGANVATFGYRVNAEVLRKKIGLRPIADDSRFLVGTVIGNKHLLLWCERDKVGVS